MRGLDEYLADDPKDREKTCEVCEATAGSGMSLDGQWVCDRCEESIRLDYGWYACKWWNDTLTIIVMVHAKSDADAEVQSHDLIRYDNGIKLDGYYFEYELLDKESK